MLVVNPARGAASSYGLAQKVSHFPDQRLTFLLPFVRWQRSLFAQGWAARMEAVMSVGVIFVGFSAITSALLAAMLLGYETFADAITDFAAVGVLLGLGAFVVLTAMRMIQDRQDHR